MILTAENLASVAKFTGPPVEKEVTWEQDGDEITATVFIRRLGYEAAVSAIKSWIGNEEGIAGRIAACTCDNNGNAIFSVGDITGDADPDRGPLEYNLVIALLAAINEVNQVPKERTPSPKSSGMNSSSMASAERQSRKQKKT